MRRLRAMFWRLGSLFHKRRHEQELAEELESHLQMHIEDNLRAGLSPQEARRRALIKLGGLEQTKEICRDRRGLPFLETFLQDLRYGARMLAKNPGFTVVAVLTLALGIGANTVIFSVVNAVLLRPLPFPDQQQLVTIWKIAVHRPDAPILTSAPNFFDWQKQANVFESMAIFDSAGRGYNLTADKAEPEQVQGLRVTASFFQVLGVRPLLGRTFLREEETPGRDHVVVLSYGLWQRRYHSDPSLVGKTILVDSVRHTVVGVMPPEFKFQYWSGQRDLWVPIGLTPGDHKRNSYSFIAIGRLKRGVTLARARAEMDAIGRRLAQQYPQDNGATTVMVEPMSEAGLKGLRAPLWTLLGLVGFVLLIACVNVANLTLARGAARRKELAIRQALGAGRAHLARQLLTESLLLAFLGGVGGFLIALWSSALVTTILPGNLKDIPLRPIGKLAIDGRVFAFTLLVSCITGILFGLAPAWKAFRSEVHEPLKEGGRGSTEQGGSRLRQVLVASEVALALVVLVGAGLMLRSMARLLSVDPGFDPKNVLIMNMSLPQANIYYGPPTHKEFCQDLEEQVGSIPGIVSVSSVAHLPLVGGSAGRSFTIESRPDPGPENQPVAGYSVACPNYLRTMAIPLVAGHEFNSQDVPGAPGVIVINEAMARAYWPKEDPVGKRIKLGHSNSKEPWLTVVGVYRNVRHRSLAESPRPEFLRPYNQAAWPFMSIVVRTASAPGGYISSVKGALRNIEPDRPVSFVATMQDAARRSVGSRRFAMILLTTFAGLALVLAAVGVSGVVSYSVVQGTHEIGIRVALGAERRDVLRFVVRQGLEPALIGVAVGLAAALALSRAMTSLLYGIRPTDPATMGGVCIILTSVAVVACLLPALRAARLDPMEALRHE